MHLVSSDANIHIDIEDGNLTNILFQLPYEILVSDFLFENELKEKHSHLLDMGLKVKALSSESIKKIGELIAKYPKPSFNDHSALALAIQEQCPLLTGDKDLRAAAKNEGVQVHGTIWIMEKFLEGRLIKIEQARSGFNLMKARGSRLPWSDVEKILDKWASLEIKQD